MIKKASIVIIALIGLAILISITMQQREKKRTYYYDFKFIDAADDPGRYN